MEYDEFRELYPHRVLTYDLTWDEMQDLRRLLDADAMALGHWRSNDPQDQKTWVEVGHGHRQDDDGKIVHFYVEEEKKSSGFAVGGDRVVPLVKGLVELGLNRSSVLSTTAGAVGKGAVDILVDRVKKFLAKRPHRGREVEIYGPDNHVVRIVKTFKKEIQISSEG